MGAKIFTFLPPFLPPSFPPLTPPIPPPKNKKQTKYKFKKTYGLIPQNHENKY